jgi:lipopolysaccharide export system permease protein
VRILSRHFLASYLGLFALTLVIALVLMTVIEMLMNFDEVVEHRDEAGGAFTYLFVRVPSLYFRDVVPAASFIAAFLSLGLAARAREIMAIKTGGVPPQRIVVPILLAAGAISAVTLLVNETLLLGATREFTRLQNPNEPVVYRRGSFWYHRGNAFYNVRESNLDDRELRGVKVFELNARGRLVQTLRAETVSVGEDDRWHLHDATLRRFDSSAPEAPPQVERIPEAVIDAASNRDLLLLDEGVRALSVRELLDAIQARRRHGREAPRIRSIFHARLAEPLSVLIFALLALPIALGVERTRSIALSALYGVGVVALFQASWRVVVLLGQNGIQIAAAGPWIVLAGFAGLGAWLLARAPR